MKIEEKFIKCLDLLAKSPKQPDSNTLISYCRILGWNFSLKFSPEMAVEVWNTKLPKSLKIDKGSFDDKGITPEELETWQVKEIAGLLGIETEFGKPSFDCFWQWRVERPETSKVELARRLKAFNNIQQRHKPNAQGYGAGRYMGD